VYKAIAKDLVWNLKFQGTQAAASEIAERLAKFVPRSPGFVIIPVPTATSRVRQRGYDQANLIARELARKTGVAYSPALRRSGQFHQLGSSRKRRISQLQDAYRVAKPLDVKAMHVILIDDVLTTGSTLEAAAKVIKAAGAERISGLVFARA
jgi:ComF family protein